MVHLTIYSQTGKNCKTRFLHTSVWIYLFICCFFFCLFGHLPFLLLSHINLWRKSLHRIYTILIQYVYTGLLSNSLDSSQECPLNFFFLLLFFKSSNSILIFFTVLLFLIWLGNLYQKHTTLLAKKSYWFVDLVFNCKFPVQGEI